VGLGEALALAAPAVWGLAVVLFRRSGESMPAFELNLFKNVSAFLLLVPTIWLVHGRALPTFSSTELMLVLASGVLGMAVADTWYFRALNLLGAGRAGIIASLLSPFVILLSALFLGERLGLWQWAGFVLVMAGILLVTWRRRRREVEADELRTGVFLGVGAVMLMSVGVVMVKEILERQPFLWVVELRLLGGVAAMLLLVMLRGQWRRLWVVYRSPHRWGTILTASFLGGYVATLLWLGGYRLLPASEASIYNEAQASFIVLFAWLILGERISARKLAGLALTVAGVVVMLLV
jgi:drug/metabolite transporter (DMT)-like permease